MPNYEYECQKCGHGFEVFQKMTDPKLKRCPVCGGKVVRLIGPGAGVVFKGSGFYSTDYGRGGRKKTEPSKEGGSDSGPSEKKSDSDSGAGEKKAAAAD